MSYTPSKMDPWTLLLLLDSAVNANNNSLGYSCLQRSTSTSLSPFHAFLLLNELFSVMHWYIQQNTDEMLQKIAVKAVPLSCAGSYDQDLHRLRGNDAWGLF